MNVLEAAAALRARRVSSVELTTAALSRIERHNADLRVFITVTADAALQQARQADADLATGKDRGPLHGLPVAVKDLFLTRGVLTTAGSKIYADFVPDHDAAVVERLKAAGAVMLGKLNMHELAYGITSANPHFGPVRNPWNVQHSPGGSSGGSGAAAAARMAFIAMGSDTGGSIRIPAAFCGVAGLKPTYGRVSRFGAFPLSWSLDHMGPLARTVRDTAIALNAIAGRDPRDPASARRPTIDFVPEPECSIRGVRIGFPEGFFFEAVDSEVKSAVRGALARAASLGADVRPVRLPDMDAINAVARVILLAEASAALTPHLARRDQFGPDVLALFDQGRLVPAVDYVNAQRLRRLQQREFDAVWSEVDCLITPTTPASAPRIGQTTVRLAGRDEDVRLAATRLLRGINLLGLPALSIPCGLTGSGLPVGLQIVGPAFDEALILKVGAALEDNGVGVPPCPIE
ncbi:MAG: Asp-tRNA(Asn)/Glu-tRNA(Gln) amidotransferase GatCAB subunit A [Acidobacteria bacterium]|nr:Asp-tRNA(Asn)/Glu-tRNA(Gln) amidotransferase GatCAB subunit A [Acidobacteriota bacterium]